MITFQITQDFGNDNKGSIYFDVEENTPLAEIRDIAISTQRKDYEDRMKGFMGTKTPEKPILKVRQYGEKVKKKWF